MPIPVESGVHAGAIADARAERYPSSGADVCINADASASSTLIKNSGHKSLSHQNNVFLETSHYTTKISTQKTLGLDDAENARRQIE